MEETAWNNPSTPPNCKNKSSGIFSIDNDQVKIGSKTYTVTEITTEELSVYRKKKIPSLVVKTNGKLLYTRINPQYPITFTPCHMCNDTSHDCCHLIALDPADGGCNKVIEHSRYIERFDFITEGYETFNTVKDAFIVIKCNNYQASAMRGKAKLTREDLFVL
jgi:hypothetical protein